MNPLREIAHTRQIAGEPRRRWFTSNELDLIVWLNDDEQPVGFQLCYDKLTGERALTWREGRGFDHSAVDDGEGSPTRHKATPILVADGVFQRSRVSAQFERSSEDVPNGIRRYVIERLDHYPEEN